MKEQNGSAASPHSRVGLFVTCLADMFRPSVAFATVKLLEDAGCTVEVPASQICCGQPAFNSGDQANARALAESVIAAFEGYDYVVGPSGSCIGMLQHYPELFEAGNPWHGRAVALASRSFEIVSFLVDVLGVESVSARYAGTVTYHDSCSGLRELGVKAQPRKLLASVQGLSLTEMNENEVCCGFGGTFCIKYPEISNRMVSDKIGNIAASGADTLLAGDLGCLLNMGGKLKREGSTVRVWHVAEVLAGMTDGAPIGDAK